MKKDETQAIPEKKKSVRISQSSIPAYNLKDALKIATALYDSFASSPTSPILIAQALEISPTSTNWRYLLGSSTAYGLTLGTYNSDKISITDLGKKIIAPTTEGSEIFAKVEAMMKPDVLNKFFTKYNNSKLPKENIIENVLREEFEVPHDKTSSLLKIINENGDFTGVFQQTKSGNFILIDNPVQAKEEEDDIAESDVQNDVEEIPKDLAEKLNIVPPSKPAVESYSEKSLPNNNVFITHGKNKKIVEQVKELLIFGQFVPIISVEKETTAIAVPEKVFNDMRSCSAAVIHIESEQELLDKEGNVHYKINENVLIEIGAAIALYGKRFVLLCEKSVKLPSNLQGLYRCNYEGPQLDYDATMKLLKTFNEIRI